MAKKEGNECEKSRGISPATNLRQLGGAAKPQKNTRKERETSPFFATVMSLRPTQRMLGDRQAPLRSRDVKSERKTVHLRV